MTTVHTAPVPPSRYAYVRYGCRCDECTWCNTDGRKAAKARRAAELAEHRCTPRLVHGSQSTYNNYACRCAPCRRANTAAGAERRRQRAA